MGLAIDKFEYSSDASAQAAYVSSVIGFLGTTTQGGTNDAAQYVHVQRFVATSSGIAKYVYVDANVSGPVKVAFYVHSNTAPTTLLATGSANVASATWNAVALAVDATVANGATYWIGVCSTVAGCSDTYTATGQARKYKSITFATYAYPNPFVDSGYTANTSQIHSLAVYGVAFQAYSEATTKSEGSYSLKGVIVNTAGLGKTLTKTFT